MKDSTKEAMRKTIQRYIDDLKAIIEDLGDNTLEMNTLYGGKTLKEEIKLAEERLTTLT